MNIKRLFASFCCFVSMSCVAQVHSGEYIHVPGKRPVIGIFPYENSFTVGDVGYEAKFCLEDSKYHCFASQNVKFAVPKNLGNKTTWTYDGETYRVMQRFSTRGEYPAWSIEKSTGLRMWFVWSSHHGLTMIGGIASKDRQGGYMLDGVCGFAADSACKMLQNK